MQTSRQRAGFTLMELVIVISILAILAGTLIPRITNRMASARDARRLSDVHAIRDAIDQFYLDHGRWPKHDQNPSYGGWDVSQDGTFLVELVEKGYLTEMPKDPVNDDTYHYRYFVFEQGAYGCRGETPFFVLGVKSFETTEVAEKNAGFFKCAERNWGDEFAYVTGGGASWK
ncbi:MAG: prepilin-type N-terminal cleavage/methylation domain-containing protein [Planctomycetes bacterium]|nr:prepilin-type N-terminal cleavage/methylation domain-containing protein [Planctomycetota bacterium]